MNPAKTKTCPTCSRTLHQRAIVCHCGATTWAILGGGFEGGHYELVGEVPIEDVLPLIDENAEIGLCGKIKIEHLPFKGETVKIRIRNTFAVFKRQPSCVGCGAAGVKCLLIQRDPTNPDHTDKKRSYNLVFITADHIPLTIDHIVPRARNGKHTMANLQTMCFICNNDKGTLSFEEYKRRFGESNAGDIHQTG